MDSLKDQDRVEKKDLPEEVRLEKMVAPLLAWYQQNRRVLPWREVRNPYYTWVSEIMLQQTRVEAVKPYFHRFVTELPDIQALADCPEDKLMKLWEGLGYYSRVRNMQKAAKVVCEMHGGQLPPDVKELEKLPGIGSYTAGAIASIAFDLPAPAVDGNVLRILARLLADEQDILQPAVKKEKEKQMREVMPQTGSGELNQALMDLGATVCIPNGEAACGKCPIAEICLAHEQGKEALLPVRKAKKKRRVEEKTILLLRDGERVALQKRPAKGLLAGLYEFPNLEGKQNEDEILEWLGKKDLLAVRIQKLPEAKHVFSHVEWHMCGYEVRLASGEEREMDELIWVNNKEIRQAYSVPSAYAAYRKILFEKM